MTISASIIVKNEESVIARCIDSALRFADEIVIVDTGSTDGTKDIVAAYPSVKLFDSEHFNADTHYSDFQFNVAKNEAIARTTGDWVVWLDADDWIDEESAKRIRRLAETEETCLFSFRIITGAIQLEHCRMFRNGVGIGFDLNHSCHEFLLTKGYPNYVRHEVVVAHAPGKRTINAVDRNLAIMENDYNNRGLRTSRICFYLGQAYRDKGDKDKALEFFREYLKKSNWREERFFARLYVARLYLENKDRAAAREESFRALAEDPRFAEAYCMLGDIALEEKKYSEAQGWYSMAKLTPVPDAKMFMCPALYSSYPEAQIKKCENYIMGDAAKRGKSSSVGCELDIMGSVGLPENVDDCLSFISVLSCIGMSNGKAFAVRVGNEWQEKLVAVANNVIPADGKVKKLEIPESFNGKTREEVYCRAVGFVVKRWDRVLNRIAQIREEIFEEVNAN
jgi:glycosyltransferase involved in cell wall biosynthesis